MSLLFDLEEIHYGYRAGYPVLEGASFQLRAGERVALTGANGAGKTTLFQLMVGLISPHRGRVTAFGRERTQERDFREVRARAGILFQDSDDQLFSPTVREDVAFGPLNLGRRPDEADGLVSRTLDLLGMSGYEERITHRLSGGEKRLIALATVLAMEPEVLLLDEPTNALDQAAEARLLEILDGLPQAMVVISHQQSFLDRLATREALLEGGRITTVGRAA